MSVEIMTIVSTILGIAVTVLLPPLYDGIHRKIRARIHCRVGPPIMQTWYDILKLMVKQDVIPETASKTFLYAPSISLAYLLLAAAMIPIVYWRTVFDFTCDIILVIYLLSSATVFLTLGSLGSGNIFAVEGARRELMIAILTELTVIFSFIAIAIRFNAIKFSSIFFQAMETYPAISSIVASLLLISCAYIEGFKLPFELPEAEPEIAGGSVIEYSGRRLALFKLSIFMKQFLLIAIAVNVIEPWSLSNPMLGLIITIVKVSIVYIVFAIWEPLFGRFRVYEALRSLLILCALSIIAVILSLIGV